MKTSLHAGALALALILLVSAPVFAQAYDPAKDPFASNADARTAQCTHWAAVTPSDATDLARYPKAIYAGVGGDIAMVGAHAPDGSAGVVWKSVPAGVPMPVVPRRILATGTTATNIVACY